MLVYMYTRFTFVGVGFVDCGCSRHDGLSKSACTVCDHMHVKSSDTTELNRGCSYSQGVFLCTVDVLIHSGFSYTQWVFLYTVGVIRDLPRNTKHYFIRLVTNQRALTIWLRQNFATSMLTSR